MVELKSLTLGNGEAYAKRLSKTLKVRRTYQGSYLEQTSSDNPVLLTNVVARLLLEGHILYLAEAHTEDAAVPHITNYAHVT
jgi:bifunctional ADP-heptose synthase (sugar kinase/adenylyltransferase)